MIDFSSRKRGEDVAKSAESKFSITLSCSIKIYMVLISFEVSLDSLLMSSGDVRDALEMYSWRSLMEDSSSSSCIATTKSVSPFWEVR